MKKKEKEGKIYCFGWNLSGQLGIGNKEKQNKPVDLMERKEIKEIACGEEHTMILKTNGDLLVCGSNLDGQLGIGEKIKQALNQKF